MSECRSCGKQMPPERDPRTVVYCSAWCYGRDTRAEPSVHIYPTSTTSDVGGGLSAAEEEGVEHG